MSDKIHVRLSLEVEATLVLNERECAALEALTLYGDAAFLKCFYKNLGESALRPYEAGLKSLFAKVRQIAPPTREKITRARKALANG